MARASWPVTVLTRLDRHPVPTFAVLTVVVGLLFFVNLRNSPDFLVDELYYTLVGRNIGQDSAISSGLSPFLVHPPLYFYGLAFTQWITGSSDSSVLDALFASRTSGAFFSTVAAVLTGITARSLADRALPWARSLAAIVATLLVATNGFLLAFGRTVLIEPAAIALGAGIVLAAHTMRRQSVARQVLVVGILIGVGCLLKQTVVFAAFVPLVAGLLERDRRRIGAGAGALLAGGLMWVAYPVWTAFIGSWHSIWSQQTVSIQRLFGLVTTTGVGLPSGDPITQFLRTFVLYSSGYVALVLGGIAWLVLLVRSGRLRRGRSADSSTATLLAYGLMIFGFFAYSFLFGAGNQHLASYVAPPSALLCVALFSVSGGSRRRSADAAPGGTTSVTEPLAVGATAFRAEPEPADRPTTAAAKAGVIASVLTLLLGAGIWTGFYAVARDDGTTRMAEYVAANVAPCVPVNGTGARFRWQLAMPDNPVTGFSSGPAAVAGGTHLFLLSPKDSRYHYGNSNEELQQWVQANGTLLVDFDSRSNEELQLWAVQPVPTPAVTAGCAQGAFPPDRNASATTFAWCFLVALVVAPGAVAGGIALASRRRRARA